MATSFPVMQDLTLGDTIYVKLYQNAMENGAFDLASTYLSQITNADKKIVNASFINRITNAINSLEDYVGQSYVVSSTQPTSQTAGDWWFEVV